jgi:response regulator of citrate/malate metabolism
MGNLKDIAPGLYMMAAVLGGARDEEHVEKSLRKGVGDYLERLGTPHAVIESLIASTKKSNSRQNPFVRYGLTIIT